MSRRDALRHAATAGAATFLSGRQALAQERPIEIGGKPVEVNLTSVTPSTVRLTVLPLESDPPKLVPNDGALVKEDLGQPAARLRTMAAARSIKCGTLTVKLTRDPLTIRVEGPGGRLLQELQPGTAGKLVFRTGEAPVLGLGQGGPQFDKRGSLDRMGSGQGGYKLATHGAKVPVQLAVGTSGWAMFVHQPLGSFDFTGKDGVFAPTNADNALPLDVFLIGSAEPAVLMSEYARITGLPEMPPMWAFGYQQSHRTLDSPEQIIQEAKTFREKKLPCDMMIYLGTDFCPNGWNTHNGEFTWNEKAFPNPKQMVQQLHDLNFKVVLHTVVEGRHFSGTIKEACTAEPIPSGRLADGRTWPPNRQVACYWPVHKPLLDVGIDGWWPDQGDGFDGPSRLLRNRMYFEGHQMYRPNERVYALHRNGYAGMARYASFLWSGDVQSTWETLKTHVSVGINAGLSGIPYWGSDIGGFVPTQEFTGELYARWFQFAAFNPLFRSHGREWRLRLPWGWNRGEIGGFRETPAYHPDANELHNAAIEPVCKKYLELRYQMTPYLYSAAKETCDTGMPIIRALWLHYPADAQAVSRGDQYLYGRDMLVAPVVEKGAESRTVYLPRGVWYDFWTREKVEGGREVTRKVDLETIPLFVRAGAVIPMGPVKQYTAEKVAGPLTVWIYPGADGTFSWYEDDGTSFDFRRGEFMRVNFAWSDRQRRLTMRLASGSKMLAPTRREIVLRVANEQVSRNVVFEGRPVDIRI